MTPRARILLGVLLVIAMGLALLDSLVVPREWVEWLPAPGFGFVVGVQRQPFVSSTPQPGATPAATPTPGGSSTPQPERERRDFGFRPFGFGLSRAVFTGFWGYMAGLLFLLVVGTLTLYLAPRRIGLMASALGSGGSNLARLALVGLAGYIMLGVLGVLAAASVLGGITVLFVTLVLYITALVGFVAISLPLGRLVGKLSGLTGRAPLVELLAGLLIVFIVSLLPFVGVLALALLAIIGFGAIVQTRAGSERGWDFNLEELRY